MTGPVRIALIGCGRIAQVAHLPALEKADGVELVAVSDPSQTVAIAIARRYDVRAAYSDVTTVWNDPSIEAVLIAAPDRFHFDLTSAALRAGKHVLVEKPLASTTEQAEALVDLVQQTGLKLQVGAMKRHDAGLQYTHQFVRDRLGGAWTFHAWYRIGNLRRGIEATLFPRVYAEPQGRAVESSFKEDRQRYLLATHGSHIFDTVRYMLGDIASVDARHRSQGRDQSWSVLVTTTSGAVGTVSIAAEVPGLPTEGIEIFGSTGSVRADTYFPFYRLPSSVQAYADGLAAVTLIEATAASVESRHEVKL